MGNCTTLNLITCQSKLGTNPTESRKGKRDLVGIQWNRIKCPPEYA